MEAFPYIFLFIGIAPGEPFECVNDNIRFQFCILVSYYIRTSRSGRGICNIYAMSGRSVDVRLSLNQKGFVLTRKQI